MICLYTCVTRFSFSFANVYKYTLNVGKQIKKMKYVKNTSIFICSPVCSDRVFVAVVVFKRFYAQCSIALVNKHISWFYIILIFFTRTEYKLEWKFIRKNIDKYSLVNSICPTYQTIRWICIEMKLLLKEIQYN